MERTKLLILRITNRCNLACKYCYAQGEKKTCDSAVQNLENNCAGAQCRQQGYDQCERNCDDMSLDTAIRAINLLAGPGDKLKVQFTGGEPLLCLDLMKDIFQYMNHAGIQGAYSVQTNGTLLNDRVCQVLRRMRCAVGVSLDGIGAANGLRVYGDGRPAFPDTLKGIENLGRQGISCNLNAVVSRINQGRLSELADLAGYLKNVRGIGLDMFRPMGRGEKEDFAPNEGTLPGDLEKLLQRQAELASLGITVKIKELEKVRSMLKYDVQEECYCYAQTGDSFAVDPVGDIYPCSSFVGRTDMRMGNVKEGIRRYSTVPGMDKTCSACELAKICRGGCPAGRAACGGRSETDCIMHRTIIQYGRKEHA